MASIDNWMNLLFDDFRKSPENNYADSASRPEQRCSTLSRRNRLAFVHLRHNLPRLHADGADSLQQVNDGLFVNNKAVGVELSWIVGSLGGEGSRD
jgi:hypothetical protein